MGTMTLRLLEAAKRGQQIVSDYGLAQAAGISRQRINHYRKHRHELDDDALILKLAKMAELNPEATLAEFHAEKNKGSGAEHAWHRIAATLRKHAAVAVGILSTCAVLMMGHPSPAFASGNDGVRDRNPGPTIYIMLSCLRRWWRRLARRHPGHSDRSAHSWLSLRLFALASNGAL